MKIWFCKIGECDAEILPEGADAPMRAAVERAYRELTGFDAAFNFSGWGAELDESERAVVENREPSEEHYRAWLIQQAAPDLYEALKPVLRGADEADYYCPEDVADDHTVLVSFTIAELRAARALLSKLSQQQGSPHVSGQQNEGAES